MAHTDQKRRNATNPWQYAEMFGALLSQLSPRDQATAASRFFAFVAPMLPDVTPTPEPEATAEPATEPQGEPLTGPHLSPAEVAILQTLAEQPEGERLTGSALAAEAGYSSSYVRKFVGPRGTLATAWGVRNDSGGYHLTAADRERVRLAFPM